MQSKYLGPFCIFEVVGRGGMGAVYEAIHSETQEKAAIKVLLFPFEEDEELRLRFEAEIETLKHLRHPNIVRLFGFGEEQQVLYYVMEFVNGQSLQQELRQKRFFTWGEVCKIGLELSQALKHAHDRGIIHRDIKPANILLEYSGNVKLSDFGIAHIYGGHRLTHANSVVGTLEYMSPEQSQGGPIGPKTDLYSLGVVLYTLLVGTPPYQAKTLAEVMQKHQGGPPPRISETRPDVPDVFESLIMELLSIKPENRPTNAYILGRRFEVILKAYLGNPGLIKVLPSEKNVNAVAHVPQAVQGKTSTFNRAAADSDHSFLLEVNGFPQSDIPAKKPKKKESLPSEENDFTKSQIRSADSFEERVISETATPPEFTEVHIDLASHKPSPGPIDPLESLGETEAAPEKHSRFIPVGEEELGGFSKYEDQSRQKTISIQTIFLSICLLGIGFFINYLLQPIPADTLYNRIIQVIGVENADENGQVNMPRLLKAESNINLFLDLYPSDSRREHMYRYIEEIKLEKLQREFDLRINRLQSVDNLQPLERICLEAFTLARTQPEKAEVKFQAILALYGSGLEVLEEPAFNNEEENQEKEAKEGRPRSESRNDLCLELVRRRLLAIQTQSFIQAEDQKEFLQNRLDKAAEIEGAFPEQADAIRRGIIEIYQDKPWAVPYVKQAKEEMSCQRSSICEL